MTFTVTYNGNGATGGGVPATTSYAGGDTVTVISGTTGPNPIVKSGATFAYWNTKADGSGTFHGWPADTTFLMPSADVTLYAQWFVSTGLTNGGITPHFSFAYDSSLELTAANPTGIEPARTNQLIGLCEGDLKITSDFFGGTVTFNSVIRVPVVTYVTRLTGGANTTDSIRLKPNSNDVTLLRYLLVSEVAELFMDAQRKGWFAVGGGDESFRGEALSRFLGQQFLVVTGIGVFEPGFDTAYQWLNSSLPATDSHSTRLQGAQIPDPTDPTGKRQLQITIDYGSRLDYINYRENISYVENVSGKTGNHAIEGDNGILPNVGCVALFLYYLRAQLGFSVTDIVTKAPLSDPGADPSRPSIREVYRNLTGDDSDPFPFFYQLLDAFFPSTLAASIPGPNPDNPFPLIPFKQGTGSSFSLSTATDAIEVFWIRSDGMVFTNGRDPNFNQDNWNNPINNVAPAPGSADPRSGVAAVSTQPGAVEVFWIRPDGMVFTNARNPNINQGNWNNPINNVAPAPGSADPRSGVAAVSTQPGAVDVFWIRPDGMVFTNARDPNFNQGNWNNPINNVAPAPGSADPRSGVAAVSAQPGVVEVFWIRTDGMVFTNSRDPNINQGNWNNPINNVAPAPGSADPRSGIAAVSAQQGTVQVFWIRPDGVVLTNARDPNINRGNWNNPIAIGSGADPRSGVAAVSRQFGCVDVLWVSAAGEIMTSARNPFKNNGDFTSPTPIAPPGSAYSSSPVGAACSSLNAVEVFWIRSDGMIFTNAQNPNINGGNWNQPINNVAPLPGSAATPQR
jgi:hypothetical protein